MPENVVSRQIPGTDIHVPDAFLKDVEYCRPRDGLSCTLHLIYIFNSLDGRFHLNNLHDFVSVQYLCAHCCLLIYCLCLYLTKELCKKFKSFLQHLRIKGVSDSDGAFHLEAFAWSEENSL